MVWFQKEPVYNKLGEYPLLTAIVATWMTSQEHVLKYSVNGECTKLELRISLMHFHHIQGNLRYSHTLHKCNIYIFPLFAGYTVSIFKDVILCVSNG